MNTYDTQPDFITTMTKRLGKRRTEKFIKSVTDCISDAIKNDRKQYLRLGVNHPLYCHGFGIMQGLSIALGYQYANITTVRHMPGFWFGNLVAKLEAENGIKWGLV